MRIFILLFIVAATGSQAFSQSPVITSFSPVSGPVGTQVVITGTNFSATPNSNIVYFGPVKAAVSAASATSLTVNVPVGATFRPVSVTVNNLSGFSAAPFIVTYPDGGMDFTASSFSGATNFNGGGSVTAADLDGDHKTDLIYTRFSSDEVIVYRNTTSGTTLSFSQTVLGGAVNPIHVKAADINGDGLLDLVVANPTFGVVYVFKNSSTPGTISFDAPLAFGTGSGARKIAVADIDKDGKTDIVSGNSSGSSMSVLRNTSTAGTISFSTKVEFTTVSSPEGVATGDLNGDGKPDVAVAGYNAGSLVSVLINTSTPGTITFDTKQDFTTGAFPWDVAISDVDGDGKSDLLASSSSPNTISIFRNTSTTGLTFATRVDFGTTSSPRGIDIGDLNADGKPDIVSSNNFVTSEACVLKNNSIPGTITFAPYFSYAANSGANAVVLADLENDGLTDIITSNSQSNSLSVFSNRLNINTSLPSCPALLTPANNAVINYSIPYIFSWRKESNATGYRVRIREQSGAYTELTTTDTFYSFSPSAGINYTWTVTPLNMADPSETCQGLAFSTCPAAANAVTITAESATTFCGTDSVKLDASATSNIQWFLDNQPIAGATTGVLVAKKAGNYSLRVLNGSCYSDLSNIITITILPTPVKPSLSPQHDTLLCQGESVTFIADLNINNQWFKGSAIIPGSNGINYIASETGSYYVRVANTSSGCYNYSDTVAVQVVALPAAPVISVTGNLTFCVGQNVSLQSSAVTGNQWYKNGVAIPGSVSQQYIATVAGTYTVKITNINNCTSAASSGITVITTPLPTKPVITSGGTSLQAPAGFASYAWYRDNTLIAGANSNQYSTTQNGVYKVVVTDNNGCNNTSDNFNYITTGINDVVFPGYTISLFPNPVIDKLNIAVSQTIAGAGKIMVTITDATGRTIKSQALKGGYNMISLKNIPAGSYWILINNNKARQAVHILKL